MLVTNKQVNLRKLAENTGISTEPVYSISHIELNTTRIYTSATFAQSRAQADSNTNILLFVSG